MAGTAAGTDDAELAGVDTDGKTGLDAAVAANVNAGRTGADAALGVVRDSTVMKEETAPEAETIEEGRNACLPLAVFGLSGTVLSS